MKPYQERVKTELQELNDKREKLSAFICGDVFKGIDPIEQTRLHNQAAAMLFYAECLEQRIAAFIF